ncbi:hypothetical protein ScPMuIL_006068 [Solemya velum]
MKVVLGQKEIVVVWKKRSCAIFVLNETPQQEWERKLNGWHVIDGYMYCVVSLVVNVASECGYTASHYIDLQNLQTTLGRTDKFTVLAFPCNQFGSQEPGTNFQVKQFARELYGATFPLFAKINVLDDNVPQAWQYLIKATGQLPNWNFWKYLVDIDGKALDAWGPWVTVEDIQDDIRKAIKKHDDEL